MHRSYNDLLNQGGLRLEASRGAECNCSFPSEGSVEGFFLQEEVTPPLFSEIVHIYKKGEMVIQIVGCVQVQPCITLGKKSRRVFLLGTLARKVSEEIILAKVPSKKTLRLFFPRVIQG